jgi:hypothetical protein
MNAEYYALVEMGFVAIVVLGWGFWELYKLRKDK